MPFSPVRPACRGRSIAVALLCFLSFGIGVGSLASQETSEQHEFTDKSGKSILAELLGVSEDRRTMRIRREDGLEFESEIIALSLDDQQYIKDWLERQASAEAGGGPSIDYRIEFEIERSSPETTRRGGEPYELEKKMQRFAVTVTNLSREDLVDARFSYVIVWENQVDVVESASGEWLPTRNPAGGIGRRAMVGDRDLPVLAFNRDFVVETEPFELNRMMLASDVYHEDEFVGIIVRVLSPTGAVLAVARNGRSAIDAMGWDAAAALAQPADPIPEDVSE